MNSQMTLANGSMTLINDFCSAVETISALMKAVGITGIKPYQDRSLIHFSKMSVDKQKKILSSATSYLGSLEDYFVILESSKNKCGKKHENLDFRVSLWTALKHLNLRPTSDLFSYLSTGQSIEVYNAEGIQVWRNFRFFEVCGYTIEEMFCYTWQERYERNEIAMKQILDVISKFSRETPYTVGCHIYNRLTETFSQQQFVIDVIHERLSPLYDETNNVAGFVAASSAQVVSAKRHDFLN